MSVTVNGKEPSEEQKEAFAVSMGLLRQTQATPGASAIAHEAMEAGTLAYIMADGKLAKSDASVEGKEAMAFVPNAVLVGENAPCLIAGQVINGFANLVTGSAYYMGTTPGSLALLSGAPTDSGHVLMKVGVALSATTLAFAPEAPITL